MKKETLGDFDGLNLRASVFTEEQAREYAKQFYPEIKKIEKVFEYGEYWWEVLFDKQRRASPENREY